MYSTLGGDMDSRKKPRMRKVWKMFWSVTYTTIWQTHRTSCFSITIVWHAPWRCVLIHTSDPVLCLMWHAPWRFVLIQASDLVTQVPCLVWHALWWCVSIFTFAVYETLLRLELNISGMTVFIPSKSILLHHIMSNCKYRLCALFYCSLSSTYYSLHGHKWPICIDVTLNTNQTSKKKHGLQCHVHYYYADRARSFRTMFIKQNGNTATTELKWKQFEISEDEIENDKKVYNIYLRVQFTSIIEPFELACLMSSFLCFQSAICLNCLFWCKVSPCLRH